MSADLGARSSFLLTRPRAYNFTRPLASRSSISRQAASGLAQVKGRMLGVSPEDPDGRGPITVDLHVRQRSPRVQASLLGKAWSYDAITAQPICTHMGLCKATSTAPTKSLESVL